MVDRIPDSRHTPTLIAMNYTTSRSLMMAMGLGTTLLTIAQSPILPQWIHTWPFGCGEFSQGSSAPAWEDNRVVVDAVTGSIHATVSDETMLYSPRYELIYTFTNDGTELTGPMPLILGPALFEQLYAYPRNGSKIGALVIDDEELFAGVSHISPGSIDNSMWTSHFQGGPLNGPRWLITNNVNEYASSPQVAVDGDLVLLVSEGPNVVYAHDRGGWFQWLVTITPYVRQLVIDNGIAYAMTSTDLQRIDLATGTLMTIVPSVASADFTAVKNGAIYTANGPTGQNIRIRKHALNGTMIWERLVPAGANPIVTGLVVDEMDGAWVTATSEADGTGGSEGMGHLLSVDASGYVRTFTYGKAMHSLATDGSMLYMTGWSANTATQTFLIAVDAALMTGVAEGVSPVSGPQVWPVPANDLLNVGSLPGAQRIGLVDVLGREVMQWPVSASSHQVSLDVSAVPNGTYVLIHEGDNVQRSSMVVISH